MGKMNVAQFAAELSLPIELLLEQLHAAGVVKQLETDTISEQDKAQLLAHLRNAHGAGKNKITLVRRETTAIKKADSSGKSRTIQVEVRKKRTLGPTSEMPGVAIPEVMPTPISSSSVLDDAQRNSREAEARAQAELAARQAADVQAKLARVKRKEAEAEPVPEVKVEAEVVASEAVAISAPAVVEAAVVAPEGTLHKPMPKPGDKVPKPAKKVEKTADKDSPWDQAGHKKRPPTRNVDTRAGTGVRAATPVRGGRPD